MEEQRTVSAEKDAFQIRLAGRVVRIRPVYDEIRIMCRGYGCSADETPDLTVQAGAEDLSAEKAFALEQQRKTGENLNLSLPYLETLAVYRKIAAGMTAFSAFLMHGSVISTKGEGYMICAPSGIGKSTRTKLWLEEIPDSFVVNGDKPLLRVEKGRVIAFGTPWCGKEGWNTNTSVPLRAVFLLERGENAVRELGFAEAFPALLRQTYKPKEPDAKRETLRLLADMAGKVRVFSFRSEPTAEAVRMAWAAAGGSV